MEDEVFEIYTVQGEKIGVDIRKNVHAFGYWHAVIHVWLYEQIGNEVWIYLQQRSFTKKDFAGLYDITTAGHVDVKESMQSAALRECQEEIGIPLQSTNLQYIGDVKEMVVSTAILDKEIAHVFLYEIQKPTFQLGEEVELMVKVKETDFYDYIHNRATGLHVYSLDETSQQIIQNGQICHHASIYYMWILQQIRRNYGR